MRRPVLGTLFALACVSILCLASTANAVTIHRHITVQRTKRIPDTGKLVTVKRHVTRVRHLPPPYVQPTPEPVAAQSVSSVAPAPAPAPTSVATTSGGCPSYMAGEASSPSAVNPSSGAAGCYQVLPSTQAAMGAACSDVNSSSCVGAICAAEGNAAWASSGSTPCDYVKP